MIYYFFIAFISLFTGLGILRLCGLALTDSCNCLLAPIMSLCFWVIFFGLGVCGHFPVARLAPVCGILTLILSLTGFSRNNLQEIYQQRYLLLTVLMLPTILMWPYLKYGLFNAMGSPQPDGWVYVAHGQYLWQYSNIKVTGLTPLYSFSSLFLNSRYISSALLGFFSWLIHSPGDLQAATNFYLIWCIFIFCSSYALFIKQQLLSETLSDCTAHQPISKYIFYLAFTVLSIMMYLPLLDNNLDNLLVLAILPTLITLTLNIAPFYRWIIIFAMLFAATLFAYVELMPYILLGTLIIFVERCYRDKDSRTSLLIMLFGTIIVTLILISPYIATLYHYFLNQLNSFQQAIGARSGDGQLMIQLGLHPWATLLHIFGHTYITLLCLIALAVIFVFIRGLSQLVLQQQWGLVIIALAFIVNAAWMFFHNKYAYGSYKLILLSWWLLSFIFLQGCYSLYKYVIAKRRYAWALRSVALLWLFTNLFSANILLQKVQQHFLADAVIKPPVMTPFRQISAITPLVKQDSVQLDIHNGIASQWAVYFLRNESIQLSQFPLYLGQAGSLAVLKQPMTAQPKYIVTDSTQPLSKGQLLWHNTLYSLWQIPNDFVQK